MENTNQTLDTHTSPDATEDKVTPPFYRGPLKYEMDTSTTQLEAGCNFTISYKITNPYDIPVEILKVDTLMPVEFEKQLPKPLSIWPSVKSWFEKMVNSEVGGSGKPEAGDKDDQRISVCKKTVLLQPGNSSLQEFTVRTRHKIFFTPSLYNLHLNIEYKMNDITNYDTFKYQLNVRAPLIALIYGSIIGSLIGSLLQFFYKHPDFQGIQSWQVLVTLFTSALLASVLVIAFARKKDIQPVITIEDFWGGFFVGFAAGYIGKPLVEGILPKLPSS